MTEGYLGFSPVREKNTTWRDIPQTDQRFLFSVGNTWGEVFFTKDGCRLLVHGAPLSLSAFSLPYAVGRATADGRALAFTEREGRLRFPTTTAQEWYFEKRGL